MPRKKKEEIDKAIQDDEADFKLSDLKGIGPKRLEKLEEAGIRTAEDLLITGAQELAQKLDMDIEQTGKMITNAMDELSAKKKIGKRIMTARDYMDYYDSHIRFLGTGALNLTQLMGGGFESGVVTEFYGQDGSGKTQVCMLASIIAQLEEKYHCSSCDKDIEIDEKLPERCPHCNKRKSIINLGGLKKKGETEIGVLYLDTENSFRSSRVLEMIYENELVPVKEQSASESKSGKPKEPLDDEAEETAKKFLDNIIYMRVRNATQQYTTTSNVNAFLAGNKCRICYEEHKGDEDHEFVQMPPIRLVIQDSLTALARQEFLGRESLSIRQIFLTRLLRIISRGMETFNCVGIITNQIMMNATGFGAPIQPIGGTNLGHTSKHRVYLQKSGQNIVAKLVDSNDKDKGEALIKLTKKGIENAE